MAARIPIVEGMTPSEFINALNVNFGRCKYFVSISDFSNGMNDWLETVNNTLDDINNSFDTNNVKIDYGISGNSLISTLNDGFIQSEEIQKTEWIKDIKADFRTINNHIPETDYTLYYSSFLDEILASDYEDNDTVGYYYETYGPPGFAREAANFFILLFFNDNLESGIYKVLTGGNYRHNIEGEIIDNGSVPNHIYIGSGKWIISSSDWSTTTSIRLSDCNLIRYIPSFYYLPTEFELMINSNGLEGDFLSYNDNIKTHNGLFYMYGNYLTGTAPKIKPGSEYGIYYMSDNFFTSIDVENSVISTTLRYLYIQNNRIDTASLNALFAKLNTFFTTTPPLYPLTINCSGGGMGVVTGVLTEGVWSENADIIGLRTAFASAEIDFTLTYNSDETFEQYTFDEKIAIITIDDGAINDLNEGKPIFDKHNVKPTIYVVGTYIGNIYSLSMTQLVSLQQVGWDVQCHGYRHLHEDTLTEEQLRSEMADNNSAFIAGGLSSPLHHAYPFYDNNPPTQSIVAEYRETARYGYGSFRSWSYVYKNSNKMALDACFADITTDLELFSLKQEVDAAIDKKGVLILSLHSRTSTYGYDPVLLDQLIDYMKNTKGFTFMTMKEFWDNYGEEFI